MIVHVYTLMVVQLSVHLSLRYLHKLDKNRNILTSIDVKKYYMYTKVPFLNGF